jgi:hypothetical protein
MNMPAFNAEASLYKVREFYQPAATQGGGSSGNPADNNAVVQPQLRNTDYECVHDCLEAGGPESLDMCNFFCTENVNDGGGGGGGGGEYCTPQCGPCYADSDSPTGGFRTCRKANCDTYDKQCRVIVRPPHGRIWNVGQL